MLRRRPAYDPSQWSDRLTNIISYLTRPEKAQHPLRIKEADLAAFTQQIRDRETARRRGGGPATQVQPAG
jgi:hypothetical protein